MIDVSAIVQDQPVGDANEQPTLPLAQNANQLPATIADNSQPMPIDVFTESISRPISQPLLDECTMTPKPQQNSTHVHVSPPPSSNKRHSTRLAQKAAVNLGKDAIRVAQDLLVKKLGELSGEEKQPVSDDFEHYAQHFARPIEKIKMEAIQGLIEQLSTVPRTRRGATTTGVRLRLQGWWRVNFQLPWINDSPYW